MRPVNLLGNPSWGCQYHQAGRRRPVNDDGGAPWWGVMGRETWSWIMRRTPRNPLWIKLQEEERHGL